MHRVEWEEFMIHVALVYGGSSVEHDVSIVSALQSYHAFDHEKYEVELVYYSRNQHFYVGKILEDFSFYQNFNPKQCDEVTFERTKIETKLKYKKRWKKAIPIDIAFPIIHGTSGEDGCLQGFFETYRLPYCESKCSTCAIHQDKDLMKKMFTFFNYPQIPWLTIEREISLFQIDEIKNLPISKPWVIKPAKAGSSIGIQIIEDDYQINQKICESFAFDQKLVIEEKKEKIREFNLAVVGDFQSQILSQVEEVVKSDEIFSYNDKYGGSVFKGAPPIRFIPAIIDEALETQIKQLGQQAFVECECSGVVRFDFIYDTVEEKLYLNEVNLIPGSLSFGLFKDILTPTQLLDICIDVGFKNESRKMKEVREMNSFILKKDLSQMMLKK